MIFSLEAMKTTKAKDCIKAWAGNLKTKKYQIRPEEGYFEALHQSTYFTSDGKYFNITGYENKYVHVIIDNVDALRQKDSHIMHYGIDLAAKDVGTFDCVPPNPQKYIFKREQSLYNNSVATYLWDLHDDKKLMNINNNNCYKSLSIHPDGTWGAACTYELNTKNHPISSGTTCKGCGYEHIHIIALDVENGTITPQVTLRKTFTCVFTTDFKVNELYLSPQGNALALKYGDYMFEILETDK